MADSWKTDGDCEVCRRKDYCSKSCTAHKKAVMDYIRKTIAEKFGVGTAQSISEESIKMMLSAAVKKNDDEL